MVETAEFLFAVGNLGEPAKNKPALFGLFDGRKEFLGEGPVEKFVDLDARISVFAGEVQKNKTCASVER